MNLTVDQINIALSDPTIGHEILEYDDFSNVKLNPVRLLSAEDLKKFEKAIAHASKDWFGTFASYTNPPLIETEPQDPVSIGGIEGLYIVYCNVWEADDFFFFITKDEAVNFAEKKYDEFLDLYNKIVGEDK